MLEEFSWTYLFRHIIKQGLDQRISVTLNSVKQKFGNNLAGDINTAFLPHRIHFNNKVNITNLAKGVEFNVFVEFNKFVCQI